jgi:hypothetical protein
MPQWVVDLLWFLRVLDAGLEDLLPTLQARFEAEGLTGAETPMPDDVVHVLRAVGWLPGVSSAEQRAQYTSRALLFAVLKRPDTYALLDKEGAEFEAWLADGLLSEPEPSFEEVRDRFFKYLLDLRSRS